MKLKKEMAPETLGTLKWKSLALSMTAILGHGFLKPQEARIPLITACHEVRRLLASARCGDSGQTCAF